jgi:hypothetical protein
MDCGPKLEQILKPVIARTERALALHDDLFIRESVPTSVSTPDMMVFRHLIAVLFLRGNGH